MKKTGWILLATAVLGIVTMALARGLEIVAISPSTTNAAYLFLLIVAVVGLFFLRSSFRRANEPLPADNADTQAVDDRLNRLVTRLQEMNTNSEALEAAEVYRVIDDVLAPDLNGCAEAREALSRRWGLQPYADFVGRFAEGQRNIHLARQASAAGNLEETWDNLGAAEARLVEAYALLREFRQRTEHPSHN